MSSALRRARAAACGALALLLAATAAAANAPGRAAIASAHPLATAAGLEVLRAGGNAFDAAVAVSAALAVVEPTGSGLTGGGIYLLHRHSDGFEVAIDAREFAPAAATRDMYLDAQGNVVPDLSIDSALAAGIPGEPAGMALLATRYGRLPVAQSLAPAIRLARAGFPLTAHLRDGLSSHLAQFNNEPDVARNFLRHGEVPPLGTVIRQPELAATLEYLAHHGLESFYSGALAENMVAGVRAQGGIWSMTDLAAYRAVERAPLIGQYRGARLSFAANRYSIVDHSGGVVDAGNWELGAPMNPRPLDLIGSAGPNAGRRVLAIIALDGERLCLGYDMERDRRPTGWKHETDQLLLCITLLRQVDKGFSA